MKRLLFYLFFLLCTKGYPQKAIAPEFGTGSSENPYQIANLQNLYWIATDTANWDKEFIQIADINASETYDWFDGHGWLPIGDTSIHFTGSYNGQNYMIDELYINRSSQKQLGLFGIIENATVQKLGLNNTYIEGLEFIGMLSGVCNNSIIDQCWCHGIIYGESHTGGIVGKTSNSKIISSYSAGKVIGKQYVYTIRLLGGVAGYSENTNIRNCYNLCIVTGATEVGGLLGWLTNGSIVENCYSVGLVGLRTGHGANRIGGLIGYSSIPGNVIKSFWNIETSKQTFSNGGLGLSTSEMKTVSTYTDAGWNFEVTNYNEQGDIWKIEEGKNEGYPYLSWQTLFHGLVLDNIEILDIGLNSVSCQSDIVCVGDYDILQYGFCWDTTRFPTIEDDVIKLGSAIDTGVFSIKITGLMPSTEYHIRGYVTNSKGTQYSKEISFKTLEINAVQPEGSGTKENPYKIASFENLYWLSLLKQRWDYYYVQTKHIDASITRTMFSNGSGGYYGWGDEPIRIANYDGQFHTINNLYINRPNGNLVALFGATGQEIKNLGLINVDVTGGIDVAGLVARNSSSVKKCFVTGTVTGLFSVGGICGYNKGEIEECFSDVEISGWDWIGGLCGHAKTDIRNCYSKGKVSGTNSIGGLAGHVGDNDAMVPVINSYSYAKVQGLTNVAGGLVGSSENGRVISCFWDIEASGQSVSAEGIGKTTNEMKSLSTYGTVDWDFKNIWDIDSRKNNGYPYFRWQDSMGLYTSRNLPTSIFLFQNYPNPFNGRTTIEYLLENDGHVKLSVFDITGTEVQSILNKKQSKGFYQARFNAKKLTNGMFIYRLCLDGKVTSSKKMMILK